MRLSQRVHCVRVCSRVPHEYEVHVIVKRTKRRCRLRAECEAWALRIGRRCSSHGPRAAPRRLCATDLSFVSLPFPAAALLSAASTHTSIHCKNVKLAGNPSGTRRTIDHYHPCCMLPCSVAPPMDRGLPCLPACLLFACRRFLTRDELTVLFSVAFA